MEKQTTLSDGGSPTCKRGERAGIIVAHDDYISIGAGRRARAHVAAATAEACRERGLPGRC